MYHFVKQCHKIPKTSLSYYSRLIDHCFSKKSITLSKIVHAQLIKVGLNSHTFLGNRCLDLYFKYGSVSDALEVFDEIKWKNTISWNICLSGLLKFGQFVLAWNMFDEMPDRDVVSWNSMISGYVSFGDSCFGLGIFREMQNLGVRPSGFTYSILMSMVSSALHGKELHGSMIRSSLSVSNVVLGNSLIDMYGKLGIVDYAFGVFLSMEELDVISWNSLIMGCCRSGYEELALDQFFFMRSLGYEADEYTCSAVITSCSRLRNLDKGKQIFAFCVKMGFLCNTIISSAAIDMFSKCNRLVDSVHLFEELDLWDSALSNSMISSYGWHGFWDKALQLFILTLKEDIRPTEFTLSSVLSSISSPPVEQGTQVHSLVIKSGLESDAIVASSLMDMYAKFGYIDFAVKIFNEMSVRDLISWNTIIIGLAHNDRLTGSLDMFEELLRKGPCPDRITLAGVLSACSYGGFVDLGMAIFSSMEEIYGVKQDHEHYACLVDLLCGAGMLEEAINIAEAVPYEPGSLIWESILNASEMRGDLKLTELVAERLMDSGPQSSLPYLVLARIYETKGQWEGLVRVRKAMKIKRVKNLIGCSWIGVNTKVYAFRADDLEHHGGRDIYFVLSLLNWEMDDEGYLNA